MHVSEVLAVCSGFVAVAAYASYGERIYRGRVVPNAATWLIWLVLGVMNAATYTVTTRGKIHEAIIVFTVTVCVAVIVVYALVIKSFRYPSTTDAACLAAATVVLAIWIGTGSPRLASFLLQVIYITSYVPTITMLLRRREHESPTPWILAAVAYGFATLAVVFDFSGDWLSLSYPLVCGLAANSFVAVLARRSLMTTFQSHAHFGSVEKERNRL